jgi:hypothetical protein
VLSSSVFISFAIRKIPYLPNRWSVEAITVTDGNMRELSNFLVFNSVEESQWNCPRIYFLSALQSVQNCNFQQPDVIQKVIEPEPLIGWRQVNTPSKAEDVLYLSGIRLSAKFQIKQYQIEIFWQLHAVKAELTSLSVFPVRRWCCWIEYSYSLWGFQMLCTYL